MDAILVPMHNLEQLSLRWRHNRLDSVPNHQPHDCLLNRSFGHRSKKTSKLRVTGLCVGNSPVTGEFPAQMASNAENVSIWWRHHDLTHFTANLCVTRCSKSPAPTANWIQMWVIMVFYNTKHSCGQVYCVCNTQCIMNNADLLQQNTRYHGMIWIYDIVIGMC